MREVDEKALAEDGVIENGTAEEHRLLLVGEPEATAGVKGVREIVTKRRRVVFATAMRTQELAEPKPRNNMKQVRNQSIIIRGLRQVSRNT
jgi:hypothetical protein